MAEIHSIKDAFRDPLIIALVLVGIAGVLWGAVSSVRSHYQNSQEVRATNQPPADDKPQSTQSQSQAPAITEPSIEAPATGETTEPAAPAAPAAEEPAAPEAPAAPLAAPEPAAPERLPLKSLLRKHRQHHLLLKSLRRKRLLRRRHLLPRTPAAPEAPPAQPKHPLSRSTSRRGACGGNASCTGSSASGRDAARG